MRKYTSILALISRGTIFKILVILLVSAALQVAMFGISYNRALDTRTATAAIADRNGEIIELVDGSEPMFPFESNVPLDKIFADSRIEIALGAAFLAVTAVLTFNFCEFRSKCGYTLMRLGVDEKRIFILQSVYGAFVYVIMLVFQLALICAMAAYFAQKTEDVGAQTVFLAFYRTPLLHSILPLSEWTRFFRNVMLVLCLGVETAFFSYMQRRGKVSKGIICVAALCVILFVSELGGVVSDIILLLVSCFSVFISLLNVFGEDGDEDEREAE